MEGYMPSEVARLILGYLKEMGCTQTWKLFLEENPNLQEYAQLLRQGKEYPTTIAGRSLHTILQEYYTLTSNDGAVLESVPVTRPSINPVVHITETSFRTPEQASISNINKQSINQRVRTRSVVALNRNSELINRVGNSSVASSVCKSFFHPNLSPVRSSTRIHFAAGSAVSKNTSTPVSGVRTNELCETAVGSLPSDIARLCSCDSITNITDTTDHSHLGRTSDKKVPCSNSHIVKYPGFLVAPKSVLSKKCSCRRNTCSSQSVPSTFRIQNEKQASPNSQQPRVISVVPENSELTCEISSDSCLRVDTGGSHINEHNLPDKSYQISANHCSCEMYCHSENSNACQLSSIIENPTHNSRSFQSSTQGITSIVNIPTENSASITNSSRKYFRSISVQTSKTPVKSKAQNICLNSCTCCSSSIGNTTHNTNKHNALFSTKYPDDECISSPRQTSSCPATSGLTQTIEKSINIAISSNTKNGTTCSSVSHEKINQSVVHLVSDSANNSTSLPASSSQTIMPLVSSNIQSSNASAFQEINSNVSSPVYLSNNPAAILHNRNTSENRTSQKVTSQFCNDQNTNNTVLTVYTTNANVFASEVTSSLPAASSSTKNCYSSSTDVNSTCMYKNALMSTISFSPVSACDNQPPVYCRAPGTNSPRIILSHERSLLPSLTTPVKDIFTYEEFRSPRRKSLIPRRRLLSSMTPLTKQNNPDAEVPGPSVTHSEDSAEHWAIVDEIINFPPLIEKIAENINKVKSTELCSEKIHEEPMEVVPSSPVRPLNSPVLQDIHIPDTVIKDILIRTETDPVFEEYIHHLCEKYDSSRDGLEMSPSHDTILFSPVHHQTLRVLNEELDENSSQHDTESALCMVNQPQNYQPDPTSSGVKNNLKDIVTEKKATEDIVASNESANTDLQETAQVPPDAIDNAEVFLKDSSVVSTEKKSASDQAQDHSPNQKCQLSPLCITSENTDIVNQVPSSLSPSKHVESNLVLSSENGKTTKNQEHRSQEKSVSSPKQLSNIEPNLQLEETTDLLKENNSLSHNEKSMIEVISNQSCHMDSIDKELVSVDEQISHVINSSLEGEPDLCCNVIDEVTKPNSTETIAVTEKAFSCSEVAVAENSQELPYESNKIISESTDNLTSSKEQKTAESESFQFHDEQQFQPVSEESGSPTVIFVPTDSSDLQSMPANSSAFLIVHSNENVKHNFFSKNTSETPVLQIPEPENRTVSEPENRAVSEPENRAVSENHINLENVAETMMKTSGISNASCNTLTVVNNPLGKEYWTPVMANNCGTFEFAYEGTVSNATNVKSNVVLTATPTKLSSGSDFHFVTLSPGQLFGISSAINLEPKINLTRMPGILPKLHLGTSHKDTTQSPDKELRKYSGSSTTVISDSFVKKTKRGRPRKNPAVKKKKPAICFPESNSKIITSKKRKQVIVEKENASNLFQSMESFKGSAETPAGNFALRIKGTHHSPQLKSLISSARQLAGHGGLLGRSHIRALDFGPEAGKKPQQTEVSEKSTSNLIISKLLSNSSDHNSSLLTNISNINSCVKETNYTTLESSSQLHMPSTTVSFILTQNENTITLHPAEEELVPITEISNKAHLSNFSANKNLSAALNVSEVEKDVSFTLDEKKKRKACSSRKPYAKRRDSKKCKADRSQNLSSLISSDENYFSASNENNKQVWIPARVASAASTEKSNSKNSKNSLKSESKKRPSLRTNSNFPRAKNSAISHGHSKPKCVKTSSVPKLKVKIPVKHMKNKSCTIDDSVKFPNKQFSSYLDVEKNVAALHESDEQVWKQESKVSAESSQEMQSAYPAKENIKYDKDIKKDKKPMKALASKRITPITITKKVCKADFCVTGKELSTQKVSNCFHDYGETTKLSELSEAVYFISNNFDKTCNGVHHGTNDNKLNDDAEVAQTLVTLATTVPSSFLPDKSVSAQKHTQEQVHLQSEVACEVIVSPTSTLSPDGISRQQHSHKTGKKRKILGREKEVKKKSRRNDLLKNMNVDEFLSKVKYSD